MCEGNGVYVIQVQNIIEMAYYSSKWLLIHSRFLPAVDKSINNWINSYIGDTLLTGIAYVRANGREQ